MSDAFDKCWDFTLGVEKGFFDDPAGGPTMYGVTQRVARAWGYQGDMQLLPLETAKSIARKEYFDRYQCGQLPPAFALLVFDTAYNGGKPIKWLQEAVGTVADGIIGAKTIAAARVADKGRVVALFCAARLNYMAAIPGDSNDDGWMNRIAALMRKAVQ